MARYEFSSVFSDEIKEYIRHKVASGCKEESFRNGMIYFDRFCNEHHLSEKKLTFESACEIRKRREHESNTTYYSRVNSVKQFLTYINLKGYDVFVIRDVQYKPTDFQPHIYSPEESRKYFLAVDSFFSPEDRKVAIQYPVLFRILYCCGTRITETLSIKKKDIDLDKGTIILNETKNNKQRAVVLSEELRILLKTYAEKCFYLLGDEDYIFPNTVGGVRDEKEVYEHHRIFLKEAGIPYLGEGKGPRLHDWRHHMAVYSFKQLIDSGLDMYVALPILSAYLGHKTIFATERYIRLTMQIFPYIEEKFKPCVDKIFSSDLFGGEIVEDD